MRHLLISLHRWVALIATPLFLLVTLTGVILAFRPILADLSAPDSVQSAPTGRIVQLVEKLPGNAIRGVQVLDENSIRVTDVGDFSLDSGAQIGDGSDPLQNFFGVVQDLHKSLLLHAGWATEILTYLMLGIIIVGLFLGLPKLRNSLIGWHQMLAWGLLPLVIMIPFTAILMTLHIGAPELPIKSGGGRVEMVQALQMVSQYEGGDRLVALRGFKGGSMLVTLPDQQVLVTAEGMTPLGNEPYWPKELHEGTWAGAWSGALNAVGGLVLAGLTLTGALSWIRRARGERLSIRHHGATTLVAFASQTGQARALAHDTHRLLEQSGEMADLTALGALDAQALRGYRRLLLLVSTTGEGDLPDSLKAWAKQMNGQSLKGVEFALLALGDHRYEHFCAAGCQVRSLLLKADAEELIHTVEADGAPRTYWQEWLRRLNDCLGLTMQIPSSDEMAPLFNAKLIERTRLEGEGAVSESYSIKLAVPDDKEFNPGDLLVYPLQGGSGERLYSIGSCSKLVPGEILLTVGLTHYFDENGVEVFGRGSGEICGSWEIGEERPIGIRPHPGFNPPEDDRTPLILIATGCGIAPFIGFIQRRAALPSSRRAPIWLLFGNRQRSQDFFYSDYLQQLEAGVIAELDTLFSRDGDGERYVTDRLINRGEQFMEWIDKGAQVYVCGRASTLGKSIVPAFESILAPYCRMAVGDGLSNIATPEQRIAQWQRDGVLKMDLFG